MSFEYPLTLPDSFCVADMTLGLKFAVGVDESDFTFEDNTYKWPGERWTISYNPPPTRDRKKAEEWFVFMAQLRGRRGTFLAGDPLARNPRGIGGGMPQTDGAGQSGYQLLVKNAPENLTGWLLPGDMLQIGLGLAARMHKVEAQVDTDSSGGALIDLFPILNAGMANNAPIILTNARGIFRMDSNDIVRGQERGGVYRYSFTASEVK